MHDRIIGPFFFVENTVSSNVYLDMLTNYAIPQLQDRQPNVIFQQDWEYVKDLVYQTVVPDINNLRERIASAIATVTPQMLENVWRKYEYHLDILRATEGAHVEVFHNVTKLCIFGYFCLTPFVITRVH
jgi:hypothetical protein